MYKTTFLTLFSLFLCLYSTTAKSVASSSENVAEKSSSASFKFHEMIKVIPAAVLKDLDRVHQHVLRAKGSDWSGHQPLIQHANITGFPSCHVGEVKLGEATDSIDFEVICPQILVRYKSKQCTDDVDLDGFGKCHFCYNNYVLKFKADVLIAFTEDLHQYLKTKNYTSTFEKRQESSEVAGQQSTCQFADGLPEEQRTLQARRFEPAVFKASTRKIMKDVDEHLKNVNLLEIYNKQ